MRPSTFYPPLAAPPLLELMSSSSEDEARAPASAQADTAATASSSSSSDGPPELVPSSGDDLPRPAAQSESEDEEAEEAVVPLLDEIDDLLRDMRAELAKRQRILRMADALMPNPPRLRQHHERRAEFVQSIEMVEGMLGDVGQLREEEVQQHRGGQPARRMRLHALTFALWVTSTSALPQMPT